MYINICENSNVLSVILLAKEIITVISILVPIILIVMSGVDIMRYVFNPDNKVISIVIKRFIAAGFIFFVPTLVSLLLNLLSETNYSATACWTNADNTHIAYFKAIEEAEKEAAEAALANEKATADKEREELAEAREKIREQNSEIAEEAKKSASSSSSSSSSVVLSSELLNENGTDGMVKVIDGIFYKPNTSNSGSDGTKGSAPYGYVIFFYNRLVAFQEAASKAGYTISYSTSEYGAWRPYANQAYFYCCYKRGSEFGSYCSSPCNNGNLAAYPGKSNHGWGIASDLTFSSTAAKYWAHDNAATYGLAFPLCNNVRSSSNCTENWHIEPAVIKTYSP